MLHLCKSIVSPQEYIMLRAIIFDFDGVIVDSEVVHLRAFQKILAEVGIALSNEAYYTRYLGLDDKNCFRTILTDFGRAVDDGVIQNLVERKSVYYATEQDAVPVLPGAAAFIQNAASRYPLAIGSGALRREIVYALRRAGLESYFQVIVSAEDIQRSKPAPDVYNTALARLNDIRTPSGEPFLPTECVVIEDARHGIASATAAGMGCVAVATSYSAAALQEADLVVSGMDVLTLDMMESIKP